MSGEFFMAQPIAKDSWLREPRFTLLRKTLEYASTKTKAIPALSKISPEEAAHLFLIMQNGYKKFSDEHRAEGERGRTSLPDQGPMLALSVE